LSVTPDLIKADEQLSMELWDSDRSTSDDVVGKVELSMQKMIQYPGKMYPQFSKLRGMDEGNEMPEELHWEVGYFGKLQFRPALRTHGKGVNLPDQLKDRKELKDIKANWIAPPKMLSCTRRQIPCGQVVLQHNRSSSCQSRIFEQ
jgi:Ca2+-dependent lipid-binding protein